MTKEKKSQRLEIRISPNELDRLSQLCQTATDKTGVKTSNSEILVRLIDMAFYRNEYYHSGIIHQFSETEIGTISMLNLETGQIEF